MKPVLLLSSRDEQALLLLFMLKEGESWIPQSLGGFLSIPFPDGIQLSAVVLQQCSGVMNCTDNGSDLVWGSFEEIVLTSAFEISSDFRRALSSLSVSIKRGPTVYMESVPFPGCYLP